MNTIKKQFQVANNAKDSATIKESLNIFQTIANNGKNTMEEKQYASLCYYAIKAEALRKNHRRSALEYPEIYFVLEKINNSFFGNHEAISNLPELIKSAKTLCEDIEKDIKK